MWNLKQAAVNFSQQGTQHARGPGSPITGRQLDTGAGALAYLPSSEPGFGNGDAKCDVCPCVKGEHCWEPLLRLRHNHVHVLAAGGMMGR